MKKLLMMIGAAGFLGAFLPYTAQARSMLYYYDFDAVENGALVYSGTNKGSGQAVETLKNFGSDVIDYATGALGSAYAFNSGKQSGLWIGDGATSMGCGTAKGFTIAFWVKAHLWHSGAWTDFFGFRLAGYDYRFEYVEAGSEQTPNPPFQIYGGLATGTSSKNQLVGDSPNITELPAGEWKHFALVFSPGTNSTAECGVYVDGEKINALNVLGAGDLTCVRLGTLQMRNGEEYSHSAQYAHTPIDELAVFDYPVSMDQLKWLCKFTPGQPSGGPRRAMPVLWHFDETDGRGLTGVNAGTGAYETFKWNPKNYSGEGYNDYGSFAVGAFNSTHSFALDFTQYKYYSIFCVTNLEETVGNGYSFSFWLYANDGAQSWRSIFGYVVGSQNFRLAWGGGTPRLIYAGGSVNSSATFDGWTPETWNHVCVTWNQADQTTDVYINGVRKCQLSFRTVPAATDKIARISVGPWAEGSNINEGYYTSYKAVRVDEFAFFNHSLSPDQIKWLGERLPAMPPMDATNLVRTVSADCSWAGGLASWGVREWDGSAWTATARTTIWPSCEDVDVETTVSFTGNVTITNDTFVTCKSLLFSNTSGAASVAPTLVCAEGSRFAPQSLKVDDGVVINASVEFGNPLSVGGTLTFGENAKIVFDQTALAGSDNAMGWKTIMTFGGISLPAGESDVLSHFGISGGKYGLKLSSDGRSLLAKEQKGLIISFY